MEEIERQIKEIKAQISYWQGRTFDINPLDGSIIKTTITSLEYVLYNLEKMKIYYEQNPPQLKDKDRFSSTGKN